MKNKQNKRLDFIPNKQNKYSIRKFTVGTASILLGAALIFGSANDEAKAAEKDQVSTTTNSNEEQNVKAKGNVQTSESTTLSQVNPEQVDVTKQNVETDVDNNSSENASNNEISNETSKQESTENSSNQDVSSLEGTNENNSIETSKNSNSTEESQSTLNSNNDATNEAKSEQPSTEETTKQESKTSADSTHNELQSSTESDSKEANKDVNIESNPEQKDAQTPEVNSNEQTSVENNNSSDVTSNSSNSVNTSNLDTSFKNIETQLDNATDNTAKEEALTNFVAENSGSSVEEASKSVKNLNIDYNNVNNKALLSALINSDSNKKDSETTYATTSDVNTTRSIQPKSRLAVNKLAAASQGQNVNDLITVSNQYIEEGQNNDGIIRAHEGEPITYHSDITVDDAVNSGDTMTIDYDSHTIPSDLTDQYFVPDIADSNGDIIATGTYDDATKRATYTFTDFVDTHSNVTGTLSLSSFIDKSKVPARDTNIDMTFKTANTAYNQNFTVDYQYPEVEGDSNI